MEPFQLKLNLLSTEHLSTVIKTTITVEMTLVMQVSCNICVKVKMNWLENILSVRVVRLTGGETMLRNFLFLSKSTTVQLALIF